METSQLYRIYLQHPQISTDTRKILPSSLFFALKGDKFDANAFAEQAIAAGAAYAIIDDAKYRVSEQYILVDDVLGKLQDLARYHRKQLTIPVIGLTGTNGKTTTKELINAVLSQRYKTYATQGNLNNHIGVPLSILSVTADHQMAVIEMGANHQKEIEMLCTISQPTHGLITNVGKAHLEGFGGPEGVKIAKGELYDYLQKTGGVIFANTGNEILAGMRNIRGIDEVIGYGTNDNQENFINGKLISNTPYVVLQWQKQGGEVSEVATNLTGAYNMENILTAVCIGSFFDMTDAEINAGISGYTPGNNRSQITKTATNVLICDYYNANPSSMALAIENIATMDAANKVMILGDMFELGDDAPAEHRSIIEKAISAPASRRLFIGKAFYDQKDGFDAEFFSTTEEAINTLKDQPVTNATVLLKGSRGMALERLVELF
ncbi:UDP-N-acetylmuramoyl-tripeptide--D-alanyl-D-alanine ligase [Mucilaginibacter ginkgonis]|uniref:UDP-N-acetylmuramoyl-tripeptide--D-alanyl-D-alanine ligase n=1 Tax=Mucilaginibacter ginkgonis TaxID=2682091 RepID=A0A6I4HYD5_9SPHI|nr:UDP-N-acetylmuramoyl-tripeptide--D-alanyl-D-alanine ligase [Mucilaginibacter ginkgonis]QQL49515.1 UDP-N-acetylmuramoyl-tripeptide--D-alanyl-D-alanine ligase [Mucilaginibacter ginkgonis]